MLWTGSGGELNRSIRIQSPVRSNKLFEKVHNKTERLFNLTHSIATRTHSVIDERAA